MQATPRDKHTVEPVFFHALPTTLYAELLGPVPLNWVIDMCPGDGALALATHKRGICFTRLCFSDSHKINLTAHLERNIFQSMPDTNNLTYEPRLVASLQTVESVAQNHLKSNPKPKPVTEPPLETTNRETNAMALQIRMTNAATRTRRRTICRVMSRVVAVPTRGGNLIDFRCQPRDAKHDRNTQVLL